jgi:uncharacterized iron-regulated protein
MEQSRSAVPVRLKTAFLLAAVLAFAAGCLKPSIIRIADQQVVNPADLVSEASEADIIFIGEAHSVRLHHRAQLEIIKALKDRGEEVSIGMEMFRTESQDALDSWVGGEMSEEDFRAVYARNWNIPWRLYKDIFHYSREEGIPLVALNIEKKIVNQVLKEGFESLTPEDLEKLPPGIECRVDETYEDFMREALDSHGRHGFDFKNFCEAQLVWDNAMAHNAIEYMDRNQGSKMVVLAGGGHSWKRGIPAQVGRLSDYSSVVILPDSRTLAVDEVGIEDADYIITGRF